MNNPLVQFSILFFIPKINFNEEEYLSVKTFLERKGYRIFITSDTQTFCVGADGLKVKNDVQINNVNVNNFSALVIIGGNGIRGYWNNLQLHAISKRFFKKNKITAAICSAPVVLANAGILKNLSATCYYEDRMELIKAGIDFKEENVIKSKNVITASNQNFSLQFAETIDNAVSGLFYN